MFCLTGPMLMFIKNVIFAKLVDLEFLKQFSYFCSEPELLTYCIVIQRYLLLSVICINFLSLSRMVSPWPSFEYFKFVAFLGTDRPARRLYYMGRQMVLFHVLFTATETYENTNKKKLLYMHTINAKDKVLIYWFVPDIMYIYKNENSMEIILTSNKKQHKHQNDSYISFPYYLHLFLNFVIFNSQPNNVGAQTTASMRWFF